MISLQREGLLSKSKKAWSLLQGAEHGNMQRSPGDCVDQDLSPAWRKRTRNPGLSKDGHDGRVRQGNSTPVESPEGQTAPAPVPALREAVCRAKCTDREALEVGLRFIWLLSCFCYKNVTPEHLAGVMGSCSPDFPGLNSH